jgi:hypothetical protein
MGAPRVQATDRQCGLCLPYHDVIYGLPVQQLVFPCRSSTCPLGAAPRCNVRREAVWTPSKEMTIVQL